MTIRNAALILLLTLITAFASDAFAQTEIAPFTTHGTLRVIKAEDFYINPRSDKLKGGFYGITGVPLDGSFYFYVGSGATNGFDQGPGHECPYEDTMAFRVPYTHQGMRGTSGVLDDLGVVTPCDATSPPGGLDGFNMPGGAFLYKRTIDGLPVRVGLTSHHTKTGSDFRKVLFGTSYDGVDFNWKVLYQVASTAPFNSLSPHLQPDPADPDRLFGLVPIALSGSSFYSTCIEVLFNGDNTQNATVRFATNSTCTSWHAIPFGGTLSVQPAQLAGSNGFRVQSLQKIDGEYQAWGFPWQAPDPGNAPCDPASEPYATNANVKGNGTHITHSVEVMSLTPSFQTSPRLSLSSITRDLPRAYLGSLLHPFAVEDRNGVNLLYTASQDWLICNREFGGGQGTKGDIVLTVIDENF